MKKVLITGANSYIGESLAAYLAGFPGGYQVDTLDMIDGSWRQKNFAGYNAVFHVAGLVHADSTSADEERKALYYQINTELAVESARKARIEGVRQFIFMSTASVFGDGAPLGRERFITRQTEPTPTNVYGDSKLQAEKGILALQAPEFKVVVLRPPMIYGRGCKGNYPRLSAMARRLPAFPLIRNERSMLYIDNLCEFVRLVLDNEESGIFHPQNEVFSNTSAMVQMIASAHKKKLLLIPGLKCFLMLASLVSKGVNKAFGHFCYTMELSDYKENYRVVSFSESIRLTEAVPDGK